MRALGPHMKAETLPENKAIADRTGGGIQVLDGGELHGGQGTGTADRTADEADDVGSLCGVSHEGNVIVARNENET